MNNQNATTLGLTEIPSDNLSLLEDFLQQVQSSAGAPKTRLTPSDLTNQLPILQMLLSDPELFKDQMETIQDVFEVNTEAKNTIARMAQALSSNNDKKNLQRVQIKLREIVFGVLKREIQDLDDDDEIKENMDEMEGKAKIMIESWVAKENLKRNNTANKITQKNDLKKAKEEKIKEEQDRLKEIKTKAQKEKLVQGAQTEILDRQFEESKNLQLEFFISDEAPSRTDLTPLLQVEANQPSKEIRELKNNFGFEILGNDREMHKIFENWTSKPMLQVEANNRKVEIRANLEKIESSKSNRIIEEDESAGAKKFCSIDTAKIPDTVDLWLEDDYLYEMYAQGNPMYRQIERRILFPYSDLAKSKGKETSSDLFTVLRRDLLCYEREIHANYSFPGFHRFSRDEGRGENANGVLLVGRVLRVADSSKIKSQPLTAVIMVFDNDLGIVLRTANFLRELEAFVFEGQFLALYGDVVKDFLEVKGVLPFDRQMILDNKWEAGKIEKLSNGRVKPKTELISQILNGEIEDQNGWMKSVASEKNANVIYFLFLFDFICFFVNFFIFYL